ncbi:hypothetical protein KKF32_04865 [Patescibacteria group bacterium]|nr:hypothetical protein [Patescibacteria group bacterium]
MSQKLINSLDRKYKSIIGQESDWDFYLNIADYIKYIKETPEIYQIVEDKILSEYNEEQEKLQKIRDQADEEITKTKDELYIAITKNKLSFDSVDLNKVIKIYNEYETGVRSSNLTHTEELNNALENIIRSLYENGHKELVKNYIIERDEPLYKGTVKITDGETSGIHKPTMPDNNIEKFVFAPSMEKYYKASKEFEEKKSTAYWGHWTNLELPYLAIYKKNESLEELQKDERKIMDLWGFSLVVGELNEIREQHEEPYKIKTDFEPLIYERSKYNGYITRTHNFIIDELEKIEELNPEIEQKLKSLPDEDIIDLKHIVEAIDVCFHSKDRPPFREDFFEISRIRKVEKAQIYRLIVMLDRDFRLLSCKERGKNDAYTIRFDSKQKLDDFRNFASKLNSKYYDLKIDETYYKIQAELPRIQEMIKEKPKKESQIKHSFNENGNKYYLTIGEFPEMEFERNPALIINFFYTSSKYKNDYKGYHDFNAYYKFEKDISSSDFAKRIKEINERVQGNTKNLINEIIIQKPKNDDKNNELNQYKWDKSI